MEIMCVESYCHRFKKTNIPRLIFNNILNLKILSELGKLLVEYVIRHPSRVQFSHQKEELLSRISSPMPTFSQNIHKRRHERPKRGKRHKP